MLAYYIEKDSLCSFRRGGLLLPTPFVQWQFCRRLHYAYDQEADAHDWGPMSHVSGALINLEPVLARIYAHDYLWRIESWNRNAWIWEVGREEHMLFSGSNGWRWMQLEESLLTAMF